MVLTGASTTVFVTPETIIFVPITQEYGTDQFKVLQSTQYPILHQHVVLLYLALARVEKLS
jgi:hypothetical protein